MNVYQKLNQAREDFHKLKLGKSGHNKFAGYNYFELSDFLLPALAVFKSNGLCAKVSFDTEYATMVIINVDKTDEILVFTSPMGSAALKGCHEVQNIGAVETYQRRYLWVAALEIVEHDALDATVGNKAAPVKAALEGVQIPEPRQAELKALAMDLVHYVESCDDPVTAVNLLTEKELDNDEKLFLWDLLQPNSKTRTAIKKESASRSPTV